MVYAEVNGYIIPMSGKPISTSAHPGAQTSFIPTEDDVQAIRELQQR